MATKTVSNDPHVGNLFDQAVHTFGDALKTGVRIQEEVGRLWTDAFDQTAPLQDWQKKGRAVFTEAIPNALKSDSSGVARIAWPVVAHLHPKGLWLALVGFRRRPARALGWKD